MYLPPSSALLRLRKGNYSPSQTLPFPLKNKASPANKYFSRIFWIATLLQSKPPASLTKLVLASTFSDPPKV